MIAFSDDFLEFIESSDPSLPLLPTEENQSLEEYLKNRITLELLQYREDSETTIKIF